MFSRSLDTVSDIPESNAYVRDSLAVRTCRSRWFGQSRTAHPASCRRMRPNETTATLQILPELFHAIYGYHISESIETTLYLDAEDYRRLKALARQRGGSAAQLVREAVAAYVADQAPPVRATSIGVGRSARGDVSERSEELLEGMGSTT